MNILPYPAPAAPPKPPTAPNPATAAAGIALALLAIAATYQPDPTLTGLRVAPAVLLLTAALWAAYQSPAGVWATSRTPAGHTMTTATLVLIGIVGILGQPQELVWGPSTAAVVAR